MTFFEPVPASFDPTFTSPNYPLRELQRQPWRGGPNDTLGVPLFFSPMLALTDEVAVFVGDVVAFPSGFKISVTTFGRLNYFRFRPEHDGPGPGPGPDLTGGVLRFGVGFGDGSKVTDAWDLNQPHGDGSRVLMSTASGGGNRRYGHHFWCEPLPPPGMMRFVCEWPAVGIPESEVVVDAQVILDAAAKAVPIWERDVDLPDDSP